MTLCSSDHQPAQSQEPGIFFRDGEAQATLLWPPSCRKQTWSMSPPAFILASKISLTLHTSSGSEGFPPALLGGWRSGVLEGGAPRDCVSKARAQEDCSQPHCRSPEYSCLSPIPYLTILPSNQSPLNTSFQALLSAPSQIQKDKPGNQKESKPPKT